MILVSPAVLLFNAAIVPKHGLVTSFQVKVFVDDHRHQWHYNKWERQQQTTSRSTTMLFSVSGPSSTATSTTATDPAILSRDVVGSHESTTSSSSFSSGSAASTRSCLPLPEIFIPNVFAGTDLNGLQLDDERLWVPQTPTVSFRPLCLCVSGGYYVNLLRVRSDSSTTTKGGTGGGGGILSRHRHPNPVHGFVLKGSWRYLEHDWIARPGSYIFEPPGEIHTLVTVAPSSSDTVGSSTSSAASASPPSSLLDHYDDNIIDDNVNDDGNMYDDEMITLFHVTGALLYCDLEGNVVGVDDVFTKLELAKRHYKSVGLGEDFVEQFVR